MSDSGFIRLFCHTLNTHSAPILSVGWIDFALFGVVSGDFVVYFADVFFFNCYDVLSNRFSTSISIAKIHIK